MRTSIRTAAALSALAVTAAGVAWATGPASASPATVNVVGYSIASPVYNQLEAAFQHTPAGQGVTFHNAFGASTTEAENVVAGQSADIVNFSTGPDLDLVKAAGLVSANWATSGVASAEHGFVADSTVVMVVRAGNPLGISGWSSLTHAGVKVVTPNPSTSGSARWNLLAAYASQTSQGKTKKQATAYVNSLLQHVVAEPSSGSTALTAFLAGTGNVLLAYEADAKHAVGAGDAISIVYPSRTFLIQTPAALTNTGKAKPAATAFFNFLFSRQGQNIFATQGFRPTVPAVAKATASQFYKPSSLTTISQLKGWYTVNTTLFGTNGAITKLEAANGFSA